HDLEHVYLTIVKRRDGPGTGGPGGYALRAIETSAPAGGVRNNPFVGPARGAIGLPRHPPVAPRPPPMAPDNHGDSPVTPGVDSSGDRKSVWGIRDDGATWARYNRRHTDPRPLYTAVRLAAAVPGGLQGSPEITATYRLVAVDDIEARLGANPKEVELRA